MGLFTRLLKPRVIVTVGLCISVFATAGLLLASCSQKPDNQNENTLTSANSKMPAATRDLQISPNGARDTINWIGHWYKADKRYDLVLEMKRDLLFLLTYNTTSYPGTAPAKLSWNV